MQNKENCFTRRLTKKYEIVLLDRSAIHDVIYYGFLRRKHDPQEIFKDNKEIFADICVIINSPLTSLIARLRKRGEKMSPKHISALREATLSATAFLKKSLRREILVFENESSTEMADCLNKILSKAEKKSGAQAINHGQKTFEHDVSTRARTSRMLRLIYSNVYILQKVSCHWKSPNALQQYKRRLSSNFWKSTK